MRNRKRQRSIYPLLAVLGVCAFAQPPREMTSREGNAFTKTRFGSFPCAPRGRVSAAVSGELTVRGQARGDCAYKIRQRVAAATEKRAVEAMQEFRLAAQLQGDSAYFKIIPVTVGSDTLEIELSVPKASREVVAISRIGSVKAFDIDGAVTIESGAGNLEADRIGGATACRTDGGNIRVGKVNGTLRCYSGGGEIRIASAGGETWTDTAGGEIFVTEVRGPLHATTSGGNIEVERASGIVRAYSLLGLIDIQQAGGLVSAETRGGSIQVNGARGARCDAGT